MVWAESLARSRREMGKAYRSFLKQFRGSRPIVEALESRVMMSVVPVGTVPTDLGNVTAANGVVAAYASSGRFAVAWDDVLVNSQQGVFFNVYDEKAHVVSTGGTTTGFIATSSAASNVEIAVSDSGRGVLTWVASQVVYVQQFSMIDGSLIGDQLTVPTVKDTANGAVCPAAQAKVAMAANGNFAVAWVCGLQRQVTEADGTNPMSTWLNGIYVDTFDAQAGIWGQSVTTVAQPAVLPASGTAIIGIDLAMNASGAFAVCWDAAQFQLKTSQESSGGKRELMMSEVDPYFRRFSADGTMMGKAISVGGTNVGMDFNNVVLESAMDGTGALTVVESIISGDSVAPYEKMRDQVFRRSFDARDKPTTALIPVLETDATHRVGSLNCTYDASHRLLLMWQMNEWDFQNDKADVTLQTISGDGKKILNSEKLNLQDASLVGQCTLLPAGETLRLVYVDTLNTQPVRPYTGKIELTEYAMNGVDLSVSVGSGSFRRALTVGQTVTGSLPVTLTNLGNAVAKGTARITVSLPVAVDQPATVLAKMDVGINLKGGASKTFTLKNVKMGLAQYLHSGNSDLDFTVEFTDDQGKASDLNAGNNVVTETLYVADANTDKSPDPTPISAEFQFGQEVLVPGDKGSASIVIRNMGDANLRNQNVNIVVTAVPYFGSEESVVADRTFRMSLNSGLSTTVKIPLTINSGSLPGSHHFRIQVMTYDETGWPATTQTLEATQTFDVTWAIGYVVGRRGNTSLVLHGDNGDSVSYTMSGPGYTLIKPYVQDNGNYQTDAGIPIVYLYAFDSTRASSVNVSTHGVNRTALIADVYAYSDLGSFSAAKSMVYGNVGFHGIRKVTLGDFWSSGQHSIMIYTDNTGTMDMTAGSVWNTTLDSDMAIGTLSVSEWMNTTPKRPAILAPTINRLEAHVDARHQNYGDFEGDITLRGIDKDGDGTGDYDQVALKSASIAGSFSSRLTVAGGIGTLRNDGVTLYTTIRTTGSINTLLLERLDQSSILVGIKDSISDATVVNGKYLPTSESDFVHNSDGTVRDVRIGTLVVSIAPDAYDKYCEQFYIAAASVGTVYVDRVDGSQTSGVAVLKPATAKKKAFESVGYGYWVQLNPSESMVSTKTWTPATPGPWTYGKFGLTVLDRG